MKTQRSFFALSLMIACASGAVAQSFHQFYTIDATQDRLKIIDNFGGLMDVGPIGIDVVNPDLAWHQGNLYAVDQNARLYTLDTSLGFATSTIMLTAGGSQISVEALASDGANLYISYGMGVTNTTMRWGIADPNTGSVTQIGNVEDTDGAGFDGSQFWTIDSFFTGNTSQNVFSAGYPVPATFAHGHPANQGFGLLNENDVVASIPGSLFTIAASGYLMQYSVGSGSTLGSTPYPPSNYRGLEVVPEPGTICAAAVGLVGLVLRRRRARASSAS